VTQFDAGDTRTEPFHLRDGGTEDVRMMRLESKRFPFWRTERYAAADLPYGGGAFAMTVVVPEEGVVLDELIEELDGKGWAGLVGSLIEQSIDVRLPRFTMEYERNLVDDLEAMGMLDAFDSRVADFSRMVPPGSGGRLFVQEVKQKTFVQVNEEGTEAAAVTTSGFGLDSLPPSLIADRPFLFAIRERLSGTILFLGAVVEPPAG